MGEDKTLKDKLEEAKEANLNLRFDNVEKQLIEIKDILKENSILYKEDINNLKDRVNILEEYQRRYPLNSIKNVVILTIYIIVVVTFVLAFSPGTVFETLLKLKGFPSPSTGGASKGSINTNVSGTSLVPDKD